MGVKRKWYEEVIVPTVANKTEATNMRMNEKYMEQRCSRPKCAVTRMDRWRNEKVWRRFDVREYMSDRGEQKLLKWLGNVGYMKARRLTERMNESEFEGRMGKNKPCTRGLDESRRLATRGQQSSEI